MLREEAIEMWVIPALKNTWNEKRCNEILEALEQEPCEDCISRQAALDCFTATKLKKFDFILYAREEIKKLPSVTSAEKQEPCEELDFVQPHKKIAVNLEVCKMREATQEEREGVERYIDSIAKDVPDNNVGECDDCISRQAAIVALDNRTSSLEKVDMQIAMGFAKGIIHELPSVTPAEKVGRWEKAFDEYSYWYRCSCCGNKIPKNEWGTDYFSPYCPECGAIMSEDEE